MNQIKFILGDPSGDGHEKNDSFIVLSNLSTDVLTKVYNSCKTELGFDIRDIAGEYGERCIKASIFSTLISKGIITKEDNFYQDLLETYKEYKEEVELDLEGEELDLTQSDHIQGIYDCMRYKYLDSIDPQSLLYLWLNILKYLEPNFKYKVVQDTIPVISSHIGYGLYD